MSEWVEKRFRDFIQLKRGYDLPNDQMVCGEYPVVASTQIKGFHNEYKVIPPAVITGRSGSLGIVQYTEKKCIPLNTTLYVKDFKENSRKFVYYFLQTMHLEKYNSGAGVPTLNQNHLHGIKLLLPNNNVQTRIADILSAYDDAIENNNRRIALLEKAARELYREWFVRMRFPGHESVTVMNGLPEGWEVKRLRDFGQIETGKTPPTENQDNYGDEIMFVKTPDMHGDMFVTLTGEYLSEKGHLSQPKKLLPANSIMISCIGTGGIVAINAEKAHTNQQINSIAPKDKRHMEWLYFTCKNLKETIELFGVTGTTMTNLSKGKFERLKVIQPQQSIIEAFHEKLKDTFVLIKILMMQSQNLARQRDLLLPRLMSGQLEV